MHNVKSETKKTLIYNDINRNKISRNKFNKKLQNLYTEN
jgi:hypothetical protein